MNRSATSLGAVADRQGLGDSTVTPGEACKPVGKIATEGDDVGGAGRSIFRDRLGPGVLVFIETVEALDSDVLLPLALGDSTSPILNLQPTLRPLRTCATP